MIKQKLGKLGENYAENYLVSKNYQIIKTNYYTRFGEIDIIAIDPITKEIAFVEVKTRTSNEFGSPAEAITRTKKQRLFKTALHFLNSSTKKLSRYWRIDVIGLELDQKNSLKKINHLKNILNG